MRGSSQPGELGHVRVVGREEGFLVVEAAANHEDLNHGPHGDHGKKNSLKVVKQEILEPRMKHRWNTDKREGRLPRPINQGIINER